MAEGLNQIAEYGKQMGIAVTVEDFDDRKSPLSCVGGILWFLKQVPLLKVTFDTGNFIIHGEDIMSAWDILQEKIIHMHCKDRGEEPVAVGDGYIPMHELMEKIRASHYEGYLAIEHFDAQNQEQCMEKSAAFLQKEWRA
ncbi:sugar phosphate isomerase/epimerase family protein [Roseburia sp. 831b]|uniref:sugar phosphate isomerase/epimerase family protein n=1 Tax=Roseburia sp. 831b TaxID=1261635 RepID=UPI0009531C76|nr:sugar phosphate isomerase/epimerase [Roseburia sp. 831b]WVK74170.1 sugar phosphate isomerase/epimerase [Roseburia sp. 831b]